MELNIWESFWKCPFLEGGSFNVYGTIKALQYLCLHGLKILEDEYAMLTINSYSNTALSVDMVGFSE